MTLKATLALLGSLLVLSSQEIPQPGCNTQTQLYERLSADLKMVAECGEKPPVEWSSQQTATLLIHTRNLTHTLHKLQLQECQDAEPAQCPPAKVPTNGGLLCVTVSTKRFCKPMCNAGYDFGFIRRSRLFDECSEQTGYKWASQYIGGTTLAVCNEASLPVSGGPSAYFSKEEDCLRTKSLTHLRNHLISGFKAELRAQGMLGEPQSACLVCG